MFAPRRWKDEYEWITPGAKNAKAVRKNSIPIYNTACVYGCPAGFYRKDEYGNNEFGMATALFLAGGS